MTRLTAEMIATVCGKGRRTARGYFKCCCPAHDDQRPSLLIFIKADGRLSFRCFAGCPTRRIKIALRQRGFDLSRVKRQGGAAKWTVEENEKAELRSIRWKPFPGRREQAPMRLNEQLVPEPTPEAEPAVRRSL